MWSQYFPQVTLIIKESDVSKLFCLIKFGTADLVNEMYHIYCPKALFVFCNYSPRPLSDPWLILTSLWCGLTLAGILSQ